MDAARSFSFVHSFLPLAFRITRLTTCRFDLGLHIRSFPESMSQTQRRTTRHLVAIWPSADADWHVRHVSVHRHSAFVFIAEMAASASSARPARSEVGSDTTLTGPSGPGSSSHHESMTCSVAGGVAPAGMFKCKCCKKHMQLSDMSSRPGCCKFDAASYKSLTSRWQKQRTLKTWWETQTEC